MGALSAFLRGAAGPGLIDLAQNQRREDEMERQRQQRDKEQEEARHWRDQDRRDRLDERDRELKYRLAAQYGYDADTGTRDPNVAGGPGGRRAGAGAGGGVDDDLLNQRAAQVGAEMKIPFPEARQRVQAAMAGGGNTFTKAQNETQSFDDGDRMRNVSREVQVPDDERYRAFSAALNRAIMTSGKDAKSNTDARLDQFKLEAGNATLAKPSNGAPAQAVAATGGRGAYATGGDNEFTGGPGALTRSKTAAEAALTSERKAKTDQILAEMGGDARGQAPEKLTSMLDSIAQLINTYDKNAMDPGDIAARRRLQALATRISAEMDRRGLPAQAPDVRKAEPMTYPDAPRDPAKRSVGQTYTTPRGVMKWMGNGWARV